MHLNFQLYDNERGQKLVFLKDQTYDVGKNVLLNRFCELNNMIDKNWLSLSLETFKIKCKSIFLTDNWDVSPRDEKFEIEQLTVIYLS